MGASSIGTRKGRCAKKEIGRRGEETAARFLIEEGYEILTRNFYARGGEIDIIAWHEKPYHGKTLCFVEVKTRKYNDGSAERATSPAKQRHMFRAARFFCKKWGIDTQQTPIQFEHVSYICSTEQIRHYTLPIS